MIVRPPVAPVPLHGSLDATASRDAVAFAFTVRNDGDRAVELSFPDARTHDVVALADGAEAWRWSDGRLFAQVVTADTLAPGESVTYDAEWTDPPPGEYEAVATLAARSRDVEARDRFVV